MHSVEFANDLNALFSVVCILALIVEQRHSIGFGFSRSSVVLAAKRFFDKAIGANGDPDKVAMDKSGANKAAIDAINAGRDVPIVVRWASWAQPSSLRRT